MIRLHTLADYTFPGCVLGMKSLGYVLPVTSVPEYKICGYRAEVIEHLRMTLDEARSHQYVEA